MKEIKIATIALILFGSGYCFSQSDKTGQTLNTNIKQEERITTLEKRIAEAGDDFVSLMSEEYDLLLSQPVGDVDGFEPLTTAAGGIMVGIGFADGPKIYKTDIQTIFPDIPNIGDGDVFVILDFVKGTNGLDFLDRQSNTESNPENNENDFTVLALDTRKTLQKSYWFGSRYVNLRDPKDDMTVRALGALGDEVELSALSGKVVMHLPTNITGLVLAKGDIGVDNPFAGGMITLIEINDDNISFQFTGDSKKLYAWIVYDGKGNIIDQNGSAINDGRYQISANNPQSVKIYQAEIVHKEYPFAFGNESHVISEGVSSVQEQKPAPSIQMSETLDTTMNNNQTKSAALVYLDKNDPIFLSIKGRAVTDLIESAKRLDPELPENKLIATQMETWTEEKQNQFQALIKKSISDYIVQTHLNVTIFNLGTFMLVFNDFGKMDQKRIAEEHDIRVQYLGGDKYVAEFWEDSEAHALARASNPNDDDIEIVKELIRLSCGRDSVSMEDGIKITKKVALRYTKMMALLYTLENDGSVTFHDPFQPMYDFISGRDKQ
ncbi:MAG TPA: hypothetical protein VF298_01065 [Bacteroidales bacterium]